VKREEKLSRGDTVWGINSGEICSGGNVPRILGDYDIKFARWQHHAVGCGEVCCARHIGLPVNFAWLYFI